MEVKITVGNKEYKKTRFTTGDWLKMLEIGEKALNVSNGEKGPSNAEITRLRINFLSDIFDIPEDELLKDADFKEVMDAYREIDLELTSVFLGTPLRRTTLGGVEVVKTQK